MAKKKQKQNNIPIVIVIIAIVMIAGIFLAKYKNQSMQYNNANVPSSSQTNETVIQNSSDLNKVSQDLDSSDTDEMFNNDLNQLDSDVSSL